jgi:hypothetical protein
MLARGNVRFDAVLCQFHAWHEACLTLLAALHEDRDGNCAIVRVHLCAVKELINILVGILRAKAWISRSDASS